jgi:signal transduction histidine kinase
MSALPNVGELVSTPLGNLVYHLLLLLAIEAALAMAWGEWRRDPRERSQRLLFAFVGITLVRVLYVVAALVVRAGWLSPEVLLPPLERFVDTVSIGFLGWAFMSSTRGGARSWDLVFGANLVLGVGVCGVFTVLWSQALVAGSALGYNDYWQSTVWSLWQMGLILLTALAVVRGQQEGWGTALLAMVFLLCGQILQILYPDTAASHLPVWERLANLMAYPLIAVSVYQRIVAGLRVQSRQLEDISQASMDQLKSLLYLFETSQRMSSSLDLPTVLENAVQGVARALDADQCAIAFPSDADPSQLRLAAIYNPTRRARTESATFPLEYQLVLQQAMRRRKYVLDEGSDNVQLRVLFSLLGSNQPGPLLVQPLLSNGETIGAIIVGNGRSQRPFTPNEAKLCQSMAQQIVSAIENTRRYRKAQDKIAEMTATREAAHWASQRVESQVQDLGNQLVRAEAEIDALRQARDALEIKLVSSRAETDTLTRRLATLENDLALQQPDGEGGMQSMLPRLATGLLLADGDGRVRLANAVAERLLLRKQGELRGMDLQSISDDPGWRRAVGAAIAGETVRSTLHTGAGILLCDLAPLTGPGDVPGQRQGLVVALQDLSSEAEAGLDPQEAMAAMAEELRTPMTTIVGYADLLLSEAMGGVGEAQRKFLLRIKSGAEQAVRMLQELTREADTERLEEDSQPPSEHLPALSTGGETAGDDDGESGAARDAQNSSASQGQSWRLSPQRRRLRVNKLVEQTVAASRHRLRDKTLSLDLDLADDLPAVDADPVHLQQILSRLVSNACLASPVGGRIELLAVPSSAGGPANGQETSQEREGGYVIISVKDSGGGLSEDARDRIFERTRPRQTPRGLGESGAGLAQARAWAEDEGGDLWVETETGVGTTFHFALPVDRQKARSLVDPSGDEVPSIKGQHSRRRVS